MSWFTGLAVFGIIWWLTLFMVLPFGVKPVGTAARGEGEDPGAPENPRIVLKMGITTVIACALFAGFYMIHETGVISFRAFELE